MREGEREEREREEAGSRLTILDVGGQSCDHGARGDEEEREVLQINVNILVGGGGREY